MTEETLLKIWQAMSLVAEVEEECRDREAILSLTRDAEMMLVLALVAATDAAATMAAITS